MTSNREQITNQVVTFRDRCPPLKKYSKAEVEAAMAELLALPSDAALARFMGDYGALRDACRHLLK